jgi:hypothetical protein
VRVDLDRDAPFMPWAQLVAYLREPDPKLSGGQPRFAQGDHVAIIGPTGTGKTHIAFAVAELRAYVLVVACKPKDPLVDDATRRGYHLIPGNKLEIEYVDGRPLHPRYVYWPRLAGRTTAKMPPQAILKAEKALQKPAVGGAIGYVRRDGYWCLILDEGTWVCRDLGLQRDVDSALMGFRTLKASIIILGQRPSWMGRYVLSQPTHLFLFTTGNADDKKSLGDISGVDTKVVAEIVGQLDHDRHEALYINTRTREMFRTIAPPR